ncbi:transcription antitermination factor NusB [soil metagenome]
MTKRREARERVIQALYAIELSGDEPAHVIATAIAPWLEEDRTSLRFAEKLFLFTLDDVEVIDDLITRHAENWDLSRIAVLDRLILRLAITELLRFEDIPPKVTINEAIELAKSFSTDRSASFVNGILDSVLRDLQKEGKLVKSGRGIIGMTLPS